jgi:hypothetical protein
MFQPAVPVSVHVAAPFVMAKDFEEVTLAAVTENPPSFSAPFVSVSAPFVMSASFSA